MYEKIRVAIANMGHDVEVTKHEDIGKVIFSIDGIDIDVARNALEDGFMNTATACNLILGLYRNEKRNQ